MRPTLTSLLGAAVAGWQVLVTYDTPFWRTRGLSGDGISQQGPLQQLYDSCGGPADTDAPFALCAFMYGDLGTAEDDAMLTDEAVKQLVRMYGDEAGAPRSVIIHRWGTEDVTAGNGGGRGGGHEAMGDPLLRQPLVPQGAKGPARVWQCSAETDDRHGGVMEGALRAGQRAVRDVLVSGVLGEWAPS